MSRTSKIGRGLFAIGALGALTLGASQALATPRTDAAAATSCTYPECTLWCNQVGYDRGYCDFMNGGDCVCWNP